MWKVLNNITFKTQGYRKNFNLINENDNIITEYNGTISELRISENLPPLIIGEYGFSVWNFGLAKLLKINTEKLIHEHRYENIFSEFEKIISDKDLDIRPYDKIVFIQGLVIHPDYRKLQITEEFIETIYRDFYSSNVIIVALVKPIQDNKIDAEFYFKQKNVKVRTKIGDFNSYDTIPAIEYYGLNKLILRTDTEINEYKLFSVAAKCGFTRIGESHIFLFYPEKILKRLLIKYDGLPNDKKMSI